MKFFIEHPPQTEWFQVCDRQGTRHWRAYHPSLRFWVLWLRRTGLESLRTYLPRLRAAYVGRRVYRASLRDESL